MTIGGGNRASKSTRQDVLVSLKHTARNVNAGPPVGMSLSLFLSSCSALCGHAGYRVQHT